MSQRLVEAYCADGAVVFPGPGSTLRLARGFRITVPEVRAAPNRVRNHLSACVSRALATLPEKGRLQLQWRVTSSLADRIKPYAQDTPDDAPAAVQRYRKRKAVRYLEAAEAGQLRHETVTLWLGQEANLDRPSREERKDPGLYYAGVLQGAAAETAKLASPFEAALAPLGASLEPLDATAVATAWHQTLNPSAASRRLKLTPPPEPAFSLTDLCWLSELRGLGDRGFYLDGEYHAVRVLRRLPSATYPGILDHLTTLPLSDFTLTVQLARLPREKLMAALQTRLQRLQRQLERRPDPGLEVSRNQIADKLHRLPPLKSNRCKTGSQEMNLLPWDFL